VFNPYSGVKTSILFFEPLLAQKSDSILFVKIENDGFSLGAQRRAIDRNDLPEAVKIIGKFRKQTTNPKKGHTVTLPASTVNNLIVVKEKIATNGEYNLSGERYREGDERKSVYSYVRLGDIARITAGNSAPQGEEYFNGGHAWFVRTSDVGAVHLSDHLVGSVDKVNNRAITELKLELFPEGTILFPKSGASTFLNHRVILGVPAYVSSHLACILCDKNKALPKYVYHLLCQIDARGITPDQAYPSLKLSEIGTIQIPLPPIEVQQKIVAEIECYQKIIDGARQVVDNWEPHIDVDPDWSIVELGEMCDFMTGGTPSSSTKEYYEKGTIPWIVSGDIHKGEIIDCKGRISEKGMDNSNAKFLPINSVLIALNGQGKTRGTVALLRISNATCNQSIVSINSKAKDTLEPKYLYQLLKTMYQQIRNLTGDNQRSGLNIPILKSIQIPLPPIETQRAIVADIEAEQALVATNRDLITRMEKKIQAVIARVWGD